VYSTCLFCHTSLGQNEVIESFPVGARLAFDAAKGRLWVVCRRCGRWNLTPLEERWEAVEECERRFRGTVLRSSTDNIGLTRLREGLELVRVGRPLLPELAAWRYSTIFSRRRRNAAILTAGAAAAVGVMTVGSMVTGVGTGLVSVGFNAVNSLRRLRTTTRITRRVVSDTGESLAVTDDQIDKAHLLPTRRGKEWALKFQYVDRKRVRTSLHPYATLTGEHALLALGFFLPRVNASGGHARDVSAAVELVEAGGGADAVMRRAAGYIDRQFPADPDFALKSRPRPLRLALEIVAHGDAERRAMEGELAELEQAWRDAEEIAAIADNLFLPSSVSAFFRDRASKTR
jgi:hypothetical protein